ncbi:MAG TPA: hypothetical protein VMF90_08065 [Rhizobiaceae bacterium]|nr:hypothetical protein [Rhizobiaceae bacterium]
MSETVGIAGDDIRPLDSAFVMKVFYAFAAMALLSVAISVGGKFLGQSIVKAGHSDDSTKYEVVVGNNVAVVPGNEIRFERSRRDGIAARLDLYFRWPDLSGYTVAAQDDFNHAGGAKRIIFASIEENMMSRDMSGRFEPIYRDLIMTPGSEGPNGTRLFAFDPKSGYMNELLVVAPRAGQEPFVARCLTGPSAAQSLAPCERDVHIGGGLSLTYRFPGELLGEWKALDRNVVGKITGMLKTARQ